MKCSKLTKRVKCKLDWISVLSKLEGAYAEGTLRAYRADIQAFVSWCETNKQRPFPASPKIIADFITYESTRLASSTIKRRLAAIGKIHRLLRLENPIADEDVKLALRRVLRNKQSRPHQALGLTSLLRNRLLEACPDNLRGKRNKAMFTIGYDTLARRSELSALCYEDLTISQNDTSRILIRRSKNDPFGNGRVALLSNKTTKILCEWLKASGIKKGPLFRAIKNNSISKTAIHPHTVNRLIKATAKTAGLPEKIIKDLSGHSMRIGAAQDMMISGIDILPIMSAGGWKTVNVVARYVENAEVSNIMKVFWN